MAKVDAQLSTAVALNTLSAQNSLKGLTKAVKLSTDAWKVNEHQLKSSGEYVKAAQTKYEGLGRTIDLQRKHVESLKAKQAELNVENQKDAATFAKLQGEIGKQTTRLNSLEGQYEKAGKSLKYYKSGLADLQKTYQQNERLNNSTVERLEAEGKTRDANRARIKAQRESLSNLTQQYKKQVAELNALKSAEGRSSNAFKEQQTRVNQTATAMAKARTRTAELNATGKKSHSIFGATFLGNLGANVALSGLNAIKNATVGLIKTGMQYNKEQDRMKGVWKSLTESAPKDGKAITDYINQVSQKSIYAADTINDMAQSFYHVHSSRKETEQWTKSFVALGSTLQMSNAKMAESGEMFSKIEAGGKASAEDLNVMIDRFPMWGEAMEHATGKSMKQLRAMSAAGTLNATQFTKTLDYLGKKYAAGTDNALQTYSGMSMFLHSRFSKLAGDVTKSSFNMSKSTLSAIREVTNDKSMDLYSKAISAAFSGTAKVVAGALKVVVDNRKMIMNTIGAIEKISGALFGIGKAVGSVIAADLKGLFGTMGNFIKSFTGGKDGKSLTDNIVGMLNGFAKNKLAVKATANAILGLIAIKSVRRSIRFTADLIDHTKNGIMKIYDNFGRIKRGGRTALHFTATVLDKTKSGLKWIGRGIKSSGRAIGRALKWTAKLSVKAAIAALKGLRAAALFTGRGIKAAFTFLKANPLIAVIAAVVALSAAFYVLYKHNKKFRKFINGLVSACVSFGKRALKPIRSMVKNWTKIFSAGFKVLKSAIRVFADVFTGKWSHIGRDTKKLVSSIWKYVKTVFKQGYKFLNTLTGGRLDAMVSLVKFAGSLISKAWKSTWNGLTSFFSGVWKKMKSIASGGVNAVIGVIRGLVNGINGVIHMFGGKAQTITPPKYVHFATGTGYGARRAITRPTPAIVNDGPEADNQETILRANGIVEKPKGKNVKTLLMPDDEVLNATETKEYDEMNRAHFAKGTGFWSGIGSWAKNTASGIGSWVSQKVSSLKKLFVTATKVIAHPIKAFTSLANFTGKGMKGVMAKVGSGAFKSVTDAGKNWWSQLWSMVDLDGGAAGGNWAHNPGSGWTKTSGFGYRGGGSGGQAMHDGNDFSAALGSVIHAVHGGKVVRVGGAPSGWGPVGYNVVTKGDDGFYTIYQEFGTAKNTSLKKGDVVKTGSRIGTLGRNNVGTGAHVHIGVSKNYPFNNSGSTTKGWYDLTKMHGSSSGSSKSGKSVKANKGIQSMIKNQVGSGFWSTIKKLASMFGSDAGGSEGNPSGTSVARWKPYVIKALKANHFSASPSQVSAWLRVIARESNGNPKAINKWDSNAKAGHPSKGLVQTIDSTFKANAFKGHGNIYNGYDNLLAGIHYMASRYGRGASAFARVSGSQGYANGGIVSRNQIAEIAEGNKPESIIPWDISKRSRAYQLLGKTVAHFAATDPVGNTGTGSTGRASDLSDLETMLANTNDLLTALISTVANKPVLSNNDVYTATQTVAAKKTKLANYAKGRFGL